MVKSFAFSPPSRIHCLVTSLFCHIWEPNRLNVLVIKKGFFLQLKRSPLPTKKNHDEIYNLFSRPVHPCVYRVWFFTEIYEVSNPITMNHDWCQTCLQNWRDDSLSTLVHESFCMGLYRETGDSASAHVSNENEECSSSITGQQVPYDDEEPLIR